MGESRRESDRAAAEQRIFNNGHGGNGGNGGNGGGASIVYPQHVVQRRNDGPAINHGGYARVASDNPIRRYLDEAKEQIDVIDFRKTRYGANGSLGACLHYVTKPCDVGSSMTGWANLIR